MISLNLTNYFIEKELNWKDYLIDEISENQNQTQTQTQNQNQTNILQYNRTKIVQLIDNIGNWNATEKVLKDIITAIYDSKANTLNKKEQQEDDIFCNTWKEMIISVKQEKLFRKKRQSEALKLSGQKLRENVQPKTNPKLNEKIDKKDDIRAEL